MIRNQFLAASLAVLSTSNVLAQSSSSSNPLVNFLGSVNSAVGVISSATASEASATKSSSTSPSPTSASSSSPSRTQAAATSSATAAASHGGTNHKTVIIAVVCSVVGAILLGLILALLCCCLIRRRRKNRKQRIATPVTDDEVKGWKGGHPEKNDRTYIPPQYGHVPDMEAQPMIAPAVAPTAVTRGGNSTIDNHPAYRHENPFVPVPPSPRRTAPNSRSGLTDGTVPGDQPYILPAGDPEKQRLRSRSRSHSRPRSNTGDGLPMTTNADRPPTPFGLSGIGQPYEDMHVHLLQHETPSKELHQSLNSRDPLESAHRGPTPGYTTPPEIPGRSSRRSGQSSESPYTSETGSYTGSGSDEYHQSYAPATMSPRGQQRISHTHTPTHSLTQPHHQSNLPNNRFSNSPTTMQAPPVPWAEGSPGQRRHSPVRSSGEWAESGRRASRSPATSINGQPRRFRFSDLQANSAYHGGWEGRHSHGGVGEAM